MGWFWQRALAALGSPTPLAPALRAYFLGHLGKYVPGKAMSVILRVAGVRKWVPSMRVAIISTLLETLTMMSAGALLAAATSAFVMRSDYLVSLAALGMAVATAGPTLPPVARRLAGLGLGRGDKNEGTSEEAEERQAGMPAVRLEAIDFRLLAQGWIAAGVCWLFLAISLWATLRAIGVDDLPFVGSLPRMIAVVGFSVAAGFISQLPGGLGVRDGVMLKLLIPVCGEADALVAAVLMRLVWLLSEVGICGILYIVGKVRRV
jgi:uncharacterized membrane protein YbhN (UPF0104 family)